MEFREKEKSLLETRNQEISKKRLEKVSLLSSIRQQEESRNKMDDMISWSWLLV